MVEPSDVDGSSPEASVAGSSAHAKMRNIG